jgi:hypothetical protein
MFAQRASALYATATWHVSHERCTTPANPALLDTDEAIFPRPK